MLYVITSSFFQKQQSQSHSQPIESIDSIESIMNRTRVTSSPPPPPTTTEDVFLDSPLLPGTSHNRNASTSTLSLPLTTSTSTTYPSSFSPSSSSLPLLHKCHLKALHTTSLALDHTHTTCTHIHPMLQVVTRSVVPIPIPVPFQGRK